MKKFTDLLDEYLDARKELGDTLKNHESSDFSYFQARLILREEDARNALNDAFEKAAGVSGEKK